MINLLKRSNSIGITELKISGPVATALGGIQGAAAPVVFNDNDTITTPPVVVGASPVNGCQVKVWDVGAGPDEVDAGVVTVTGTAFGAFQCAFNATAGTNVCGNTAPGAVMVGSTATTVSTTGGTMYKILGATFNPAAVRGRWLSVSGFPDAGANGLFPIAQAGANPDELIVVNPKCNPAGGGMTTVGLCSTAAATGPGYAVVIGAGPIPLAGGPAVQFLDDGNADGDAGAVGADVVISKPAGGEVPAFSVTVKANGEGFTLGDNSAQPHALTASGAQTFNCDGTNGECGNRNGGPVLNGLVIFGETSDGSLTTGCSGGPCSPFQLPDAATKYATFQCSAVGLLGNPTPTSVAITAEAMTAIMGTSPTRIQTTVANVAGEIAVASDQTSSTFVVVGHGILGFTTPTP